MSSLVVLTAHYSCVLVLMHGGTVRRGSRISQRGAGGGEGGGRGGVNPRLNRTLSIMFDFLLAYAYLTLTATIMYR